MYQSIVFVYEASKPYCLWSSSSKIFFKRVVSDKAENHWPRKFKEGHTSQFYFSNYCTFPQGSNLPYTLNLLWEVKHDSYYNRYNEYWMNNKWK